MNSTTKLALLSFIATDLGLLNPVPAFCENLRITVVDSVHKAPVADPIVTVNGSVLSPDSAGSFSVPEHAQAILLRTPGYRAAMYSPSEANTHHGQLPLTPLTVRALFLTEYGVASRALRDPALRLIREGKANALVINIKTDHGLLDYPSRLPLATSIGARKLTTISSLPDLVRSGHNQGIYMIARIVTFKDNPLATARPDLAVHLSNGALYQDREHLSWTDPFKVEVRAYNIAIAVEAAQAGFDEVQFDYVRFPDSANKLRLSEATDEANRIRAISRFLSEAHQALIPYNVFLSVDVFGYVSWNTNDTGIGQQLEPITKIVDYVCPMLYPSGFQYGIPGHRDPVASTQDIYETILLTLQEAIRRTGASPKKFRPWLQALRDYRPGHRAFGPTEVDAQIRASQDAGADGWSLWNARNQYQGAWTHGK